jgi:membrane fusion protein (multidrug efflux system)
VTESTEFIGRIEAISRVDIRARVTGFLEQRLFTEGAEVPENAPLFRIERAPFEAQHDQARANVASAEAQLLNARTALARARELRATGAGTQAALDNAQAQERTSAAALLGAQAAVRTTEINLAYTDITAPVAGAIGRAFYTPGNVVSPTLPDPLATIVSQDPMRVSFTIPQRQALELRTRYEARGGVAAVVVRCAQRGWQRLPAPGPHRFRGHLHRPRHRQPPDPRQHRQPSARRRPARRPGQPRPGRWPVRDRLAGRRRARSGHHRAPRRRGAGPRGLLRLRGG